MEHHCDATDPSFAERYQQHLKHLTLKGLQPKTVEAFSRAIRRLSVYFDQRIDDLSEVQLLEYFSDLVESHSRSTVKLDLYGLEFSRARAEKTVAGTGLDQAAARAALAGHPYRRRGPHVRTQSET